MQVVVGASSPMPSLAAKDWVAALGATHVLRDLETWIQEKEATWGECCVFIEVSFPEGKPTDRMNNQIDLLLCFPDRVAILELKQHDKYAKLSLGEIVFQVNGQLTWIKRLFFSGPYAYPFPEKRIATFLFLPNLSLEDICHVACDLIQNHSAWHVWPVGTSNELVGQFERDERWLYLCDALDKHLGKHKQSTFKPGFCEFLLKELKNAGAKCFSFPDLTSSLVYLHMLSHPGILPDPWHVPGTRPLEFARAKCILQTERMVEILGAEGIGKSTFVKELLQANDKVIRVSLEKCASVQAICRCINSRFRLEMPAGVGDHAFLQQLCEEHHVYWIECYDRESAPSLRSLLQAVRGLNASVSRFPSRWIIESRMGCLGFGANCTCQLGPLPNEAISHILAKKTAGGAFPNPEMVIEMVRGNPGQAISLWESTKPGNRQPIGSFSWFCEELPPLESKLLPLLCLAVSRSPLGISFDTLVHWARLIHPDQPQSAVQEALQSLLDRLTAQQWVDITRLTEDMLAGVLEPNPLAGRSLTMINRIPATVIEQSLQGVDSTTQNSWLERFHDHLLNIAENDTLSGVTLSLTSFGDFEPFFRSTFRFMQLEAVLDWIDRSGWQPAPEQAYLLRAARVLARLWNDPSTNVLTELGVPASGRDLDRFAFEFVQAEAFSMRHWDRAFDLPAWLTMAEREKDPLLQATLYACAAGGLHAGDRPEKAREIWDILRDLPARFAGCRNACVLVTGQLLGFLNATKVREKAVRDKIAEGLSRQLSNELITEGFRVENLQLICRALFYLVRSHERGQSRTSCANVLGHLEALRFMDGMPLRKEIRLQVLLTEGSIHRHFCRDNMSWAEFREHFEAGMLCYSRAFRSAIAQGNVMHILNSVSYMTDFCMKALRFPDDENANGVVRCYVPGVIDDARRVRADVLDKIRGPEEEGIYGSIRNGYPLVLYLDALSSVSSSTDELRSCFASLVESVLKLVAPSETELLNQSLTRIYRTLCWGESFNCTRNHELITALRNDLRSLLKGTQQAAMRSEKIGKIWKKLSALVSAVISGHAGEHAVIGSGTHLSARAEPVISGHAGEHAVIGSLQTGVAENVVNFGVFVKIEGGLSGLCHISNYSDRLVTALELREDVKIGDKIRVKVTGRKKEGLVLSRRAAIEAEGFEAVRDAEGRGS